MKHFIVLALLALVMPTCSCIVVAQSSVNFYDQPYGQRNSGSFDKHTQMITLKYGLGNISGTGYLNLDYNERISHTNIGPLYLQYEYGIAEEIGILGYGSYAYAKDVMGSVNPKDYYTHAVSLGVGALYHFNKVIHLPRLDLYAGMGLGFKSVSSRSRPSDGAGVTAKVSDNTGLFFIKLGARYYILDQLGVHLELSPDKMSALNVGLAYRF